MIFFNALCFVVFPYLAFVFTLFPSMIVSKYNCLFFSSSFIAILFSSLAIRSSNCSLFSILTIYSTFFTFLNGFDLMFINLSPYFSENSSMYPFSTFSKLFCHYLEH